MPKTFPMHNLSCHHVYAHCTSICVDCSFFPVFCIFSIERDSRSRRVRCEDRRHRWTTLEYGSTSQSPASSKLYLFCALPTKARANLTFLAYLILLVQVFLSTIILHSILATTFVQWIEFL